ncbi:MAG: hypothetical protein FWB96_02995 [Defluviitaleaceae bacterium]|nr:hypothetical protein [Defluviitaleaceae bacterium]MCL2261898.1 hypothetical protein [Defluviitaleaceae bacterium]
MEQTAFLSEGRINILQDSKISVVECEIAEKYRERAREIRRKNEWKNSGTGAKFMGGSMSMYGGSEEAFDQTLKLQVAGVSRHENKMVYSLNYQQGGGMYFSETGAPDTHVFVHTGIGFYELDVNSAGIIAVSCAHGHMERHISLFDISENNFNGLTDGECSDCNPKWSRKNENILYYDSAGIGYDSGGYFGGLGPRSIYRLNTKTGELDEVLSGGETEYISPFEDENGNLYFIRRPFKPPTRRGISIIDFLTAPFKILRAIGGWLSFFTRSYTGESLNTAGANPAKLAQKSAQEIFVDGNLIESEKNLKLNIAAGDKNAGYAPRSWELVKRSSSGEETVLHKSVISYCVTKNGVIYSNGKYIISENETVKAHFAVKLT